MMATVQTDEDFRQAAAQYLAANNIAGATVDAGERKIWMSTPAPTPDNPGKHDVKDITPSVQSLNAALTASQSQQADVESRTRTRTTASDALKGAAIAAILQNISDDMADIMTDAAVVNNLAVLSLVAFKPLMLRLLARQTRIENRLEIILKVLSHE